MASLAVRSDEAPTPTNSAVSTKRLSRGDQKEIKNAVLPKISSLPDQKQGDKSGSISGCYNNDYLPLELLVALKRQPQDECSPRKSKESTPRGALSKVKRPDSMWQYSNRRGRLQHMVEAPPCVCGSGKDISFLYDNSLPETAKVQTNKYVPSHTIIPEEYHIVKHPGVLGLEIRDEKFKISPDNHMEHLTLFPSLKPSSRFEAIALRQTLDKMLERAGFPSELKDEDLKGPTQMHKLLDLVSKEQTIYNIIFHELIRQVSIQCVERGELLAELRRRYAQLLDRIPRQIKSLYHDVVAQKALDKKLNNELRKFKSKISFLTSELNLVKEHDEHVTRESRRAEDNLSAALMSSEKNAELLHEYHGLYELQRYRLEDQVESLTSERDLWHDAAYGLSNRVIEEFQLRSLQKLQLNEKNWCKLGRHFTIMLSSKDTQQISEVQALVQEWQEKLKDFVKKMLDSETQMREKLQQVNSGISKWIDISTRSMSSDGSVNAPTLLTIKNLSNDIKVWQDLISSESEHFSGDNLVANQDEVKYLSQLLEKWADVCHQIFSRHEKSSESVRSPAKGEVKKDETSKLLQEQRENMKSILLAVDARLLECKSRIGGENGVATGFVYLVTPLETWDSKLSILLSSTDTTSTLFPEAEWIKLGKIFHDWKEKLEDVTKCIGRVQSSSGIASTLSTESRNLNLSKLSSHSTLGTPSPISPRFGRPRRKVERNLETVVEKPASETQEEKEVVEAREMKENDEQEKKEEKKVQEEFEEDTDFESMTVDELAIELESWYYNFSYTLDGIDSNLVEEVSQLHGNIVEWMIRLLLVITKTKVCKAEVQTGKEQSVEEGSKEEKPIEKLEYHSDLESVVTLRDSYWPLTNKLEYFTKRIVKCCGMMVQELANERAQEGYPNPDEDVQDLARLDDEKNEWVSFSKLLLQKCLEGKDSLMVFKEMEDELLEHSETPLKTENDRAQQKEKGVVVKEDERRTLKSSEDSRISSEISIIGEDQNIHHKPVNQVIEEGEPVLQATSSELGLSTEKEIPEGRGSTIADAEKLLLELDDTKSLLSQQEEKTRAIEENLSSKEEELLLAKARIESLEAELKEVKETLSQKEQQKKSGKPLSRGSSRTSMKRQSLVLGKK